MQFVSELIEVFWRKMFHNGVVFGHRHENVWRAITLG